MTVCVTDFWENEVLDAHFPNRKDLLSENAVDTFLTNVNILGLSC